MLRTGITLAVSACVASAHVALADQVPPGDATSPGAPGANVGGDRTGAPDPSASFPDRVGVWLSNPSGSEVLRAPSAATPSTQAQLVLVPLPPSLFAGLATLGALAGVNYLRRRRVQQP